MISIKNIIRGFLTFIGVIVGLMVCGYLVYFFTKNTTTGEMRITKDGKTQIMKLDYCFPLDTKNGDLIIDNYSTGDGVKITDPLMIDPDHIIPMIEVPIFGFSPVINDGKVCYIRTDTIKSSPNRYNEDVFSGTLDATCSSTSTSIEIHVTIKNCRQGMQIM